MYAEHTVCASNKQRANDVNGKINWQNITDVVWPHQDQVLKFNLEFKVQLLDKHLWQAHYALALKKSCNFRIR